MLKDGPIWALGAMSGASLDGVDAAMVLSDGARILEFGETACRPYTARERAVLRAGLGHWPGAPEADAAAEVVETAHAELLAKFSGYALVGFHGQTLAHEPRARGTHQVGNGAVLAEVLGRPVVWDFRSADVALGGQGAPLTPFFHFACARWIGAREPLAMLNLGGVANLTWIDPRQPSPEAPGALLAFDAGPAGALLDDCMGARTGKPFDDSGRLAAGGTVAEGVLERFLDAAYFRKIPPKFLDRNDFSHLLKSVEPLAPADAMATLTGAVAAAVSQGAEHFPSPVRRLLVAGGGRRNRTLMTMIAAGIGGEVQPVETVGLDGDMLEAQAFAHLAVRVARGMATSCPATTGVRAAIGGGRISQPSGRF